jgi:hypothetical protein
MTESGVDGWPPAANFIAVDDVVVNEEVGLDQLNRGRDIDQGRGDRRASCCIPNPDEVGPDALAGRPQGKLAEQPNSRSDFGGSSRKLFWENAKNLPKALLNLLFPGSHLILQDIG